MLLSIVAARWTTRPPNGGIDGRRDGDVAPDTDLRFAVSVSSCSAVSGCALVTLAVTSPRWSATIVEGVDHLGQVGKAAVIGKHAEEFGGQRIELHRLGTPDRFRGAGAADDARDQRRQVGRFGKVTRRSAGSF